MVDPSSGLEPAEGLGRTRLEERLGVKFANPELLERALTHRSYAFEHGRIATNERLEFLGDAVLGLVVTEEIFRQLPDAPEGRLAKLRGAAVKMTALAEIARDLDLGDHVRLGKGEAASGGAEKESILADTLEAVLGAVYLDHGLEVAESLIQRLFRPRLSELAASGAALDYKTSLQELSATRFNELPVYEVEDEGPDHAKQFSATVRIAGEDYGTGTGRNKKQAEKAAARVAYLRLLEEEEVSGAGAP